MTPKISHIKKNTITISRMEGWKAWKMRTKIWIDRYILRRKAKYVPVYRMLYLMYNIVNRQPNRQANFRWFTAITYLIYKRLSEYGMNIPLPWYWFTHGPEIEWGSLDIQFNRIGYVVKINDFPASDYSIAQSQDILIEKMQFVKVTG